METYIRKGRGQTAALKELGSGGRYYKEAGVWWNDLATKVAKEQARGIAGQGRGKYKGPFAGPLVSNRIGCCIAI